MFPLYGASLRLKSACLNLSYSSIVPFDFAQGDCQAEHSRSLLLLRGKVLRILGINLRHVDDKEAMLKQARLARSVISLGRYSDFFRKYAVSLPALKSGYF